MKDRGECEIKIAVYSQYPVLCSEGPASLFGLSYDLTPFVDKLA